MGVTTHRVAVGTESSATAGINKTIKETTEMTTHLKRTWGLIVTFVVAVGLSLAWGQSTEERKEGGAEAKPSLPLCPVMGEPVDFFVSASTETGPVFFCCPPCIAKFEKDPAKYAEKVAAQRAALARLPRVQVVCPMSGKPVRSDIFVEEKGQKIFFCCPSCADEFKSNPAKYQGKVAASYSYQTLCPVDGERIDPTVFLKIKSGNSIFFHRTACKEAFLQDPKPYLSKLEAQGIALDVSDIVEK